MDVTSMLDRLATEVDRANLERHLLAFSKWTKEAGSPGERASIDYVQAEMEALGYDVELLFHDAYISLPGQAWIEAAGQRFPCITHSFSRSSPPEGTTARAIEAGTGSPEDFARIEAGGAIVIVDGIATAPVAARASGAGALGQIHVCPAEQIHEMCISPVWGSPSQDSLPQLPATVVVSVAKSVGERLKAIYAGTADAEITLHAEVDTGWRKTPLLVAELPGPSAPADGPFVLFSGHHDTWHYGVMDNGGANATMIEVARLCALHRDQWQRGLRIAFWSGHSQGRYSGSAWYADTHYEELRKRAVAHVNIDSTGAKGNVVLGDAQADPELSALAGRAIRQRGGQEFGGPPVARAGDQSFWGIGVPSIFADLGEQPASDATASPFGGPGRKGAGTGWWWHTPDDTLDKMDLDIAVRDTRIYLHVVWELLTGKRLPIDHKASVGALLQKLRADSERLGGRFDLGRLIDRATRLQAALGRLDDALDRGVTVERINACIMDISHALVPLQHTVGDRFTHDPALGMPPFAGLCEIARFAVTEPGSDAEKFATVSLRQSINRAASALADALSAIEDCLAETPTPQGAGAEA
ncbi:M28 family peptidase [Frigidibacter sp. ROC022]|uniref:M28 family peptidase n=1 Tax=Frigidibacter sp. ROC022 TaxID=2971796 RepID=UPI00215B0C0E|nr:M28 family peptidase [Frigidibacter sp. ROC022]MCR8723502.1 M28 family peptidase [Frigidibacter sp. ROC022]